MTSIFWPGPALAQAQALAWPGLAQAQALGGPLVFRFSTSVSLISVS